MVVCIHPTVRKSSYPSPRLKISPSFSRSIFSIETLSLLRAGSMVSCDFSVDMMANIPKMLQCRVKGQETMLLWCRAGDRRCTPKSIYIRTRLYGISGHITLISRKAHRLGMIARGILESGVAWVVPTAPSRWRLG